MFVFQSTVSFVVVRHPFERLVSAYIDKLEHGHNLREYENLGEIMVMQYRKIPKNIKQAQVS